MKKIISLLLVLVLTLSLTAGCGPAPAETRAPTQTAGPTEPGITAEPAEPAEIFRFTRENFPRLDGSTSCRPMGEAICSVLLGESREEIQDLVQFNRTTQAFQNLLYGECDVVLACDPNAEVFKTMEKHGFVCDMEQISTEALVFVVNAGNPVDSVTTEQLRDVYTGKITNWKELGGEDAPIAALQRNEGAGSQALMRKLVMGDVPLMKAPEELIPDTMMGLISAVKSYDNSANAIGYTVYYYANDMEMAQGLKLLRVDGVAPDKQSIRSGSYPHLSYYYCAIAHEAPADSPARILYDWLVTEDGRRLLEAEGYVTKP